jgi:L-threonylcarbamoyladenylate synthase
MMKENIRGNLDVGLVAKLQYAAKSLKDGNLVVFPTETVYGLGADASNSYAVRRIFEVKRRPIGHPVIVHIGNIDYLDYWANSLPIYVEKLIDEFWPGPLTLILPRTSNVDDLITGGQDTVGIRFPSNLIANELMKEFHNLGGHGVAAPSANIFGRVSPTDLQSVKSELSEKLQKSDLVLDGGLCEVGIESTILNCSDTEPEILRLGSITEKMISKIVKTSKSTGNPIRSPGTLASHYCPSTAVVVNEKPQHGDGLLALSKIKTPEGVIRLASPVTTKDYARDLYRAFRLADTLQVSRIIVIPPQGAGLAAAIRDRIERASKTKNISEI